MLISQHFSTVHMVGRIAVTEDGSHDELILKDSRYAKCFNMQAASYR